MGKQYNIIESRSQGMNTTDLSCTGIIFKYTNNYTDQTNTTFLLVIIIICFLTLLFFLYKMFRLCSFAFSYSHYHIHSTYRVYALAIVNIIGVMLHRNNQWNLYDIQVKVNNDQIYVDLVGFYTLNNIIGICSLFTNNIMLVFYSITWLAISLDCDYTVADQEHKTEDYYYSQIGQKSQNTISQYKIKRDRIRIKYLRYFLLYCLLPILLIMSILGTLMHKLGDSWCAIVNTCLVTSSVLPLILFGLAFGIYLKKFSDPEISWKIKVGLVYLFVELLARTIIYLVVFIQIDEDDTVTHNAGTLLYTIFLTLSPMIVMVILSDIQLKAEQSILLRKSSVLMFKSTLM